MSWTLEVFMVMKLIFARANVWMTRRYRTALVFAMCAVHGVEMTARWDMWSTCVDHMGPSAQRCSLPPCVPSLIPGVNALLAVLPFPHYFILDCFIFSLLKLILKDFQKSVLFSHYIFYLLAWYNRQINVKTVTSLLLLLVAWWLVTKW